MNDWQTGMQRLLRAKGDQGRFLAFSVLALVMGFLPYQLLAQVKTADVVGVVSDKGGAAIDGASVTIRNLDTEVEQSAKTEGGGNYVFTFLPPGRYSVRIEKSGFKTASVKEVTLAVGDRLKLDISLDVGEVKEVVTVGGEAPALQSQTSDLSTLIDSKAVQDLPVNSRNYVTLVQLAAGANFDTQDCCSYGGGPDDRRTPSNVTVNAQDNAENNFQIDGMDNNERFVGTEVVKPSMDAIQEVRVESNLYTAELGRTGGAVVNVITKSGTNDFHGTAYEYFRNTIFDTTNWLTKEVAPYRQNQFGGSLGGRIIKNRAFFFADYEGYRNVQPTTFIGSVPTDAMRHGDFSDLLLPENYINGKPTQIFDPISGAPYPGNIIPQTGTATETGFDTVGYNVLQLYPLATNSNRHLVSNNYARTASNILDSDTFDVKLDYHFSDTNSIFARYSFENVYADQPPGIPIGDGLVGGPGHQRTQGVQLNFIHVFDPTWVMELRGGYSRYGLSSLSYNTGKELSDQVGLTGSNYSYLSSGLAAFWPIDGTDFYIGDDIYIPDINTNNVYQVEGDFTHILKSHSIKFGGELRRRQVFQNQSPYSRGYFEFLASQTGNGFATLLTGYPFQYAGGRLTELNTPDYQFNEAGLFLQDDWRARTWLTFNLGLRWDYYSPISSPNQISNFDPTTGKILIAGQDGVSNSADVAKHWRNFAPRFGFAAQVSRKTVVRGGYGISFFPLPMLSPGAFRNAPFISSWIPTQYPGPGPWRLEDGMPAVVPESAASPTGPQNDTAFNTPSQYAEQFNVTVQRELPAKLVASIGYVGNYGKHRAESNWNLNINSPGNGQSVYPLQTNGVAPNVTTVGWLGGFGSTRYDGMQATLARRFENGLGVVANYTWAHAFDNFNQEPTTLPNGSVNEYVMAWGNSHLDIRDHFTLTTNYELPFAKNSRGVTAVLAKGWEADLIAQAETGFPFTVTNVSGTVAIPLGAPSADRADQISDPFNAGPVMANPNPACHTSFSQGGIAPNKIREIDGPPGTAWFNPCAFTQQPAGTWGDAGINSLYGPGYVDFDFGVSKLFPLSERVKLQFTAQAFNLFNHPAFANPVATLGSAGFAGFDGMASFLYASRNLQFALRLSF
jgi:Carboxypeptidase regulatory-like domain/TonB dependent receptor